MQEVLGRYEKKTFNCKSNGSSATMILFLDEPSAGVDVELRQNLWKNVSELNKIGVTIILTTHNLSEAQEMCDRIGIINKGNLVALDSTSKLLDRIETKKIRFKVRNLDKFDEIMLNGVKFSKNGSQILANYDKNKFKFDQIIMLLKKVQKLLIFQRKMVILKIYF